MQQSLLFLSLTTVSVRWCVSICTCMMWASNRRRHLLSLQSPRWVNFASTWVLMTPDTDPNGLEASPSPIPLPQGSLGHRRWLHNQFPPFFYVFHCSLGLGKLQACPFPNVVFPPLLPSASSSSPFHCFSPRTCLMLHSGHLLRPALLRCLCGQLVYQGTKQTQKVKEKLCCPGVSVFLQKWLISIKYNTG